MKLQLFRDQPRNDCTLGKLYLGGLFLCFTCEDAIRDIKIHGQTAIPAGTYKIILNISTRFKKLLPLLMGVPNFTGIRIHSGNTAADTEGCILVGLGRSNDGITGSKSAMNELMPLLQAATDRGDEITITIHNKGPA